jgi:hypothetical protein
MRSGFLRSLVVNCSVQIAAPHPQRIDTGKLRAQLSSAMKFQLSIKSRRACGRRGISRAMPGCVPSLACLVFYGVHVEGLARSTVQRPLQCRFEGPPTLLPAAALGLATRKNRMPASRRPRVGSGDRRVEILSIQRVQSSRCGLSSSRKKSNFRAISPRTEAEPIRFSVCSELTGSRICLDDCIRAPHHRVHERLVMKTIPEKAIYLLVGDGMSHMSVPDVPDVWSGH